MFFDFKINNNQAFYFYHKDIMAMISKITFLNKEVNEIISRLPVEAKKLYIKKTLINEVLYTNEIEGFILTRKEINDIIESLNSKEKLKQNKINSLVNKYFMLLNHKYNLIKMKFVLEKNDSKFKTYYLNEGILND